MRSSAHCNLLFNVLPLGMLSKSEFTVKVKESSFPLVEEAYPPEIDDLYFLYHEVRSLSVVSILEFGSGWSTFALSLALLENLRDFGVEHKKKVRHPNPFEMISIDASKTWQRVAISRLPVAQKELVQAITATPNLVEIDGSVCHKFDNFPNFVPDFIYLDGPDHDQVKGDIRGFKYSDDFTPPMSADLLTIEPFLWPETRIIADGRSANVRFLTSRFQRSWEVLHDRFGDRTTLRLNENPFGSVSEDHINLRLRNSRKSLSKEIPEGTS